MSSYVFSSAEASLRVTNLIGRLEAATSRLEDIASSAIEIPQAVPGIQEPLTVGNNAPATLPAPAASKAAAAPLEPLPESIEDFDAFLKGAVAKYGKVSQQTGGLVAEQAAKVIQGFQEERKFLLLASKAKKPNLSANDDMDAYQTLLKPINESLMAAIDVKESNRGSPFANQLSAVADGIMMLAWVTDEAKPHKHVENTLGSAQYYGNRVIKDNKDKDPQQLDWVQAFQQVFKDLIEYIQLHYPSGLTWNAKGQPLKDVVKAAASAGTSTTSPPPPPPPPAGGLPPPPPPPGPPPVLQINEEKPVAAKPSGLDAVFSELNKGEAVTKGLRKVDRSEMTHKNPALRAGSTVPDDGSRGKSPAPARKPKPEVLRAKKPPVKTLDGNKWTVENYDKEPNPIEIEVELSHSVLISKCNNATIILKGKANAVTIENTNRLNLIVDSLVSSVDIVKSQNFALQVLGSIPTVMMDQIDGAQIYFSKESIATKVYHSKSANINLNVLAGEDEDYVEVPLPGQICSYYDPEKKALVDEIVSHAG